MGKENLVREKCENKSLVKIHVANHTVIHVRNESVLAFAFDWIIKKCFTAIALLSNVET